MHKQINIPFIDIEPLFTKGAAAKKIVAKQIHDVCRDHGFFYIKGYGIDVAKLQDITNDFHYTMSNNEKFEIAINPYNKNNSHIRNGYYMKDEPRKSFESFCYLNPSFTNEHQAIKSNLPLHEVNIWPNPKKHPYFQSFCEQYFRDMVALSSVLLNGFALALGKEENFFSKYLEPKNTLSAVSLIKYPYIANYPPVKVASDGTKISFNDHLDTSLITLVFQTPIANLQVETNDGWKDVPTSNDNYLVNCGTYMAHATNNYFHAPNHRVKFVNKERLSLPFFVNLSNDSIMPPFNPFNTKTEFNNKPLLYGEYLYEALKTLTIKNGQT